MRTAIVAFIGITLLLGAPYSFAHEKTTEESAPQNKQVKKAKKLGEKSRATNLGTGTANALLLAWPVCLATPKTI